MTDSIGEKLFRMKQQIESLEGLVEHDSQEIALTHERLRTASEFLREIFQTVPGPVFVFDSDGMIEAVNEATLSMLEYSQDELVGHPVATIFEPNHVPRFADITSTVARSEMICRSKTGISIPVLFCTRLLIGPDRTPRGAICVALDIRDRKALEVELTHAQKLESVGRLAAGIAHEINTPVQFISDSVHFVSDAMGDVLKLVHQYRTVCQLLSTGADPQQALAQAKETEETADLTYLEEHLPKAIERALDGLNRVAVIVRSMKEFAHPDQREMSPVNLNQAISSTVTIAKNEHKYVADVVLELDNIPLVVCFGGDMNQVFLNLIVNAAHAISDINKDTNKRGTITIRTVRDGAFVVISIQDTGGGIPEHVRARIFDPFFTTKEVGRGTGQGLSIARRVVHEKHAGQLSFETELGKGTTFYIRLPIEGTVQQRVAA